MQRKLVTWVTALVSLLYIGGVAAPALAAPKVTAPPSVNMDGQPVIAKAAGAPAKASTAKALKGQAPTSSAVTAAFTSCSGACYDYNTAYQNVTAKGVAANLTVDDTFLDRTAPDVDFHTLVELAAIKTINSQKQIVEVGVTVDPTVFGDTKPRLFVFRWVNGVAGTYNGGGFVQYDDPTVGAPPDIDPGADLTPFIGVDPGPRAEIRWFSNAWWVAYNGQWIGWFPDSVWTGASPPVVGFNEAAQFQGFWELAASATRKESCSDMGKNGLNGTDPAGTSARVGSWSLNTPTPAGTLPVLTVNPPPYPTAWGMFKVSDRTVRGGGSGFNAAGTSQSGTPNAC